MKRKDRRAAALLVAAVLATALIGCGLLSRRLPARERARNGTAALTGERTAETAHADHSAIFKPLRDWLLRGGSRVEQLLNPCWLHDDEASGGITLDCLPLVHLLGCAKCGTTAMASRLARHPNIAVPSPNKEPRYFAGRAVRNASALESNDEEEHALRAYLEWTRGGDGAFASRQLSHLTAGTQGDVMLDATPHLLLDGIEVGSHGRVLLPHVMRALPGGYGNALRPIALLRNASGMLFSRYAFFCMLEEARLTDRPPSPERFHRHVLREVARYLQCTGSAASWLSRIAEDDVAADEVGEATARLTAYVKATTQTLHGKAEDPETVHRCIFRNEPFDADRTPPSLSVQLGIYAPFLKAWRDAFPELLVLTAEDFRRDPRAVLTRAFVHIFGGTTAPDGRELNEEEWAHVLAGPDAEAFPALPGRLVVQSERLARQGAMEATRTLLGALYH